MATLIDANTRFLLYIHIRPSDRTSALHPPLATHNVVGRVLPQISATGTDSMALFADLPAFDTIADAVDETDATGAILLASPEFVSEAVEEAEAAGLDVFIVMTKGISPAAFGTKMNATFNGHRREHDHDSGVIDFASAMRRVEQDIYQAV